MAAQITSLSNAQVKNVMALMKRSKARAEQKLFVAEGWRMFREIPSSWLCQVYVSESFESSGQMEAVRDVCEPLVVSDKIFEAMADTCTPQGILALVRQPSCDLEQMISAGPVPFFLILERIQDPGNLGTILRTAEAAGCTGIIMSRDTVDIYNPKVIRSTMGAVYRVPFFYADSLEQTVERLKEKGFRIYAAHLQGSVSFDSPDYCQPCACLIGNEGNGLSQSLADLAHQRIRIPMEGKAESLNAAVSAALIMYEAYRQRRQLIFKT